MITSLAHYQTSTDFLTSFEDYAQIVSWGLMAICFFVLSVLCWGSAKKQFYYNGWAPIFLLAIVFNLACIDQLLDILTIWYPWVNKIDVVIELLMSGIFLSWLLNRKKKHFPAFLTDKEVKNHAVKETEKEVLKEKQNKKNDT